MRCREAVMTGPLVVVPSPLAGEGIERLSPHDDGRGGQPPLPFLQIATLRLPSPTRGEGTVTSAVRSARSVFGAADSSPRPRSDAAAAGDVEEHLLQSVAAVAREQPLRRVVVLNTAALH